MNIEKVYDSKTGKTSWTFDHWYFKVYFWLGFALFWFYALCFVAGAMSGILEWL